MTDFKLGFAAHEFWRLNLDLDPRFNTRKYSELLDELAPEPANRFWPNVCIGPSLSWFQDKLTAYEAAQRWPKTMRNEDYSQESKQLWVTCYPNIDDSNRALLYGTKLVADDLNGTLETSFKQKLIPRSAIFAAILSIGIGIGIARGAERELGTALTDASVVAAGVLTYLRYNVPNATQREALAFCDDTSIYQKYGRIISYGNSSYPGVIDLDPQELTSDDLPLGSVAKELRA